MRFAVFIGETICAAKLNVLYPIYIFINIVHICVRLTRECTTVLDEGTAENFAKSSFLFQMKQLSAIFLC